MATNTTTDFKILAKVVLDVDDIQKQLNEAANKAKNIKFKVTSDGADSAKRGIDEIGDSAQKAAKSVDDLNLTFNVANEVFQTAKDVVGDLVQEVYTLNDAMTEFKKVSSLRDGQLDAYVDKLAELGKQVGRTGKPNRSEPE